MRLDEKEYITAYMKLACTTVFVCFNHSTSFSNDDFSSFKNSTTEARLLRNDMLSVKFRCLKSSRSSELVSSTNYVQIYKLSHTASRTKARVVKVKNDLLHIVSVQLNQSKT